MRIGTFGTFVVLLFVIMSVHAPFASAEVAPLDRVKLEQELSDLEKEIDVQQKILEAKQKESVSLERDIEILTAQIAKSKLSIKARDLAIAKLVSEIGVKNKTIGTYSAKIERERDSLAALLRRTAEMDAYSIAEVALADKPISDLFADLDSFQYLSGAIDSSLEEVGVAKKTTEEEKQALEEKKAKEADLRKLQELEDKKLKANDAEKKRILKVTRGEEALYKKVLNEKQQKAAQIRAALFALRDTEGIPFGKALEYATLASKKTNVRPALILAILTQESDLGKNVGSCLLSDLATGDGVGKNTGTAFQQVMKAPRDTNPFEDITSRLGLDWKTTPISCPPEARYYKGRGFGGGMGPSQFIPSTWELFKERIADIVDVRANNANPWNPEHAFTATAIYLSDLGAVSGSYTSERNAACRYYSGRKCDNQRPANSFYGNQVMGKAESIQNNIDFLRGVNG